MHTKEFILQLALVSGMDMSRGARRLRAAPNSQMFTMPLFTTKTNKQATVLEIKPAAVIATADSMQSAGPGGDENFKCSYVLSRDLLIIL
jgi:hypothetical protein